MVNTNTLRMKVKMLHNHLVGMALVLTLAPSLLPNAKSETVIDASKPLGGASGTDQDIFSALWSCHQHLRGNSGEFFSPDFLCSNPALWCNWTIQVHPGMRVHLYLEDFTPDYACHLKTDQIYLEELMGEKGVHQILERCWKHVEYTSLSNTLHVVMLIPKYRSPTHRGFYGQYHTLGPPVATSTSAETPSDVSGEKKVSQKEMEGYEADIVHKETEGPPGNFMEKLSHNDDIPIELNNKVTLAPQADVISRHFANPTPLPKELTFDIKGLWSSKALLVKAPKEKALEEKWTIEEQQDMAENPVLEVPIFETENTFSSRQTGINSYPKATPLEDSATMPTVRPDQQAANQQIPLSTESSPVTPPTTQPTPPLKPDPAMPSQTARPSTRALSGVSTATGLKVLRSMKVSQVDIARERLSMETLKGEGDGATRSELPGHSAGPKEDHLHMVMKTKADGQDTAQNASHLQHLPGDVLFEVSVEVAMQSNHGESLDQRTNHSEGWDQWTNHNESWDQLKPSLLASVQTLIHEAVGSHPLKTISAKRVIRLSTGALLILWVQSRESVEGVAVYRVVHAAVQGLRGRTISPYGRVASASITDVNECGTQLVVCDVHAECVNHFGTYACRCHQGYVDKSHPGPGGTLCGGADDTDCERTMSPMLLWVMCGVCTVLGLLVVLLLSLLGALHRRHHQGAFLPNAYDGDTKSTVVNNNDNINNVHLGSGLWGSPPPPPHPWRPAEGIEASDTVDLKLLRINPLPPPAGCRAKLQDEGT